MKIIYEVLHELNYQTGTSFSFSCSTAKEYTALPFVSIDYPSQIYLVVPLSNSELNTLLNSDFLRSLAKEFRKQELHRADMDKNTTLLIENLCASDELQNTSAKVQIEDDPYYFKKYVFAYTELEESRAIRYLESKKESLGDSFSYITEIQSYLLNTDLFRSYKENYANQPTYSYFVELSTKIPVLPLQVTASTEIKSVNDFLQENIQQMTSRDAENSINIHALDRLLDADMDFKDSNLETILAQWEAAISDSQKL